MSLCSIFKHVAITTIYAHPPFPDECNKIVCFKIVRGCRSNMVKHAALTDTFNPDIIDTALQLLWDMENRSKVYMIWIQKLELLLLIKLKNNNLQRIHHRMIRRSSCQQNFDSSNSSSPWRREISRSYYRRNFENNTSPKYTCGCYTCGDHNYFVKDCPRNKFKPPLVRKGQFDKDADWKTFDIESKKCKTLMQVHCNIGNRKCQDNIYIKWEYWSTMLKMKHYMSHKIR